MNLRGANLKMVGKLAVVTAGMFCFGYALVPIYKAICDITGINVLSISETQVPGNAKAAQAAQVLRNSQVDTSRTITVEFDANVRGPWDFKPEKGRCKCIRVNSPRSCTSFKTSKTAGWPRKPFPVTPPSKPPAISTSWSVFASTSTPWKQARKAWPVAFVIDPKLSKDVTTITLSYTFLKWVARHPWHPLRLWPPRQ